MGLVVVQYVGSSWIRDLIHGLIGGFFTTEPLGKPHFFFFFFFTLLKLI